MYVVVVVVVVVYVVLLLVYVVVVLLLVVVVVVEVYVVLLVVYVVRECGAMRLKTEIDFHHHDGYDVIAILVCVFSCIACSKGFYVTIVVVAL